MGRVPRCVLLWPTRNACPRSPAWGCHYPTAPRRPCSSEGLPAPAMPSPKEGLLLREAPRFSWQVGPQSASPAGPELPTHTPPTSQKGAEAQGGQGFVRASSATLQQSQASDTGTLPGPWPGGGSVMPDSAGSAFPRPIPHTLSVSASPPAPEPKRSRCECSHMSECRHEPEEFFPGGVS